MKKYQIPQKILICILLSIAAWSIHFTYLQIRSRTPVTVAGTHIYTKNELKAYNGTDASKPILLAYEGNIYDISAGREYYVEGGSYHFLAGTDATTMLHIAGGGIIQKKYPVVGKLAL